MLNIYIRNNSSDKITQELVKRIKMLIHNTFKDQNKKMDGEIGVVFLNDDEMKKLNKKYLNRNTITDVLAFNYSSKRNIKAEIFISLNQARKQAPLYSTTYEKEILFLVCHGLLHIFGWDDKNEVSRKKMMKKQYQLIDSVNIH